MGSLAVRLRMWLAGSLPAILTGLVAATALVLLAATPLWSRLSGMSLALLLIGIFTVARSVIMLVVMPIVLRTLLPTRPLTDEELLRRLELLQHRVRVRIQMIRVLRGSGVPHALVYGFTGRQATVLLGEALLDSFTPDEVEAVVAHECGHLRLGHLWVRLSANLAAVPATLLPCLMLLQGERVTLASLAALPLIPALALSALYRRQEFAADRFAASAVGHAKVAGALKRLALSTREGSLAHHLRWLSTHPPTEERVARLRAIETEASRSTA